MQYRSLVGASLGPGDAGCDETWNWLQVGVLRPVRMGGAWTQAPFRFGTRKFGPPKVKASIYSTLVPGMCCLFLTLPASPD